MIVLPDEVITSLAAPPTQGALGTPEGYVVGFDVLAKAEAIGVEVTGIVHAVKSWTNLYDEHVAGRKSADMRNKRDRVYRVGDVLRMRRFDFTTGCFTGEYAHSLIGHIISNETPCALSSSDLANTACILSLHLIEHFDANGNKL